MHNINEMKRLEKVILDNDLLAKYNIDRIGVFGSCARGEESNDIDILLEEIPDYKSIIKFREEIQSLMSKRIDIVLEKYANPIVLHRARKEIVYVSRYKK